MCWHCLEGGSEAEELVCQAQGDAGGGVRLCDLFEMVIMGMGAEASRGHEDGTSRAGGYKQLEWTG